MSKINQECLRDHGVWADASGARRWARAISPKRPIVSPPQYVAACRAVGRGTAYRCPDGQYRPLEGEGRIDGRLVAAGWNHESPSRWIREGGLQRFLDYWWRAVERPTTAGSSCNNATPESAYWAYRVGLPSLVVRHLTADRWRPARWQPFEGSSFRRLPRRRRDLLFRAARAQARTSLMKFDGHISTKTLAALGRLCPELQRVAIEGLRARGLESPRYRRVGDREVQVPIRVRDIPWEQVSRVQAQLAADRSGRVRAAWATGQRRDALYREVWGPDADPRYSGPQALSIGNPPPALGSRRRITTCYPQCSGCSQCTRECTEVVLRRTTTYTQLFDAHWEWLAEADGSRRLYGSVTDHVLPRPDSPPSLAAWLAPSYPRVPVQIAARIARGDTPAAISGGSLSEREAHEWLLDGALLDPVQWLIRNLPSVPTVRSVRVARWLLDVQRRGQWTALTRERTILGPGGRTLTICYLDRVDEVFDVDLDRGPATGVARAFERAAERAGTAWLEASRDDHRWLQLLPAGWRLPHRMHHLATPAQLVREGKELNHCVGTYMPLVENGESVILSIRAFGQRSTVELSPTGRVVQHLGVGNSTPHPYCCAVLRRFLHRLAFGARRAA